MTCEVHAPSDNGDEEIAGLGDELEGPRQVCQQSVDIHIGLMVSNVDGRLSRTRKVFKTDDLGLI
eukprot:CAMPEP_0114538702 /NCGR_PEP_ID=MMETSP0109-20121206/30288_1 /TAXON_ID=29199 /ORGANISM="Chlorarachnion reptans, Strain CCCM449" /LENGTH=64 /DNA_ID=CAMNT_0001722747 /DNA_START=411 /DNA_END=605 /DNA_ORIENTATION=+